MIKIQKYFSKSKIGVLPAYWQTTKGFWEKHWLLIAPTVLIIVLVVVSIFLQPTRGIGSGYLASDILGQTDTNGALSYTTNYFYNRPQPNPYGLQLSSNGNSAFDNVNHRLFVTDGGNSRILVYNLNSSNALVSKTPSYVIGQVDFYHNAYATTRSGLGSLGGIDYDATNNRLYVADAGNQRVLVYDTGSLANGMNASYVLGQPDFTSANNATTQSGLYNPYAVASDPTHNRLFVGDSSNRRVLVFDTTALSNNMNASYVLGQPDFTSANNATTQNTQKAANGLAYDLVHNRLFVSDQASNRVLVYDVSTITNGMNASYVLGQANFTTNFGDTLQNKLTQPGNLTYDPNNNRLYIADFANSRVVVYGLGSIANGMNASYVLGQPNFMTASNLSGQNNLSNPYGASFNPATNTLLVHDIVNYRVLFFDTTTLSNYMNAFDALGQYNGDGTVNYSHNQVQNLNAWSGGLGSPSGVTIDNIKHRLYLTDSNIASRVLVYDLDSNNKLASHTPSYVLGEPDLDSENPACIDQETKLCFPQGAVFDQTHERLFVADSSNCRIVVYDVSNIASGQAPSYVLGQPNFTSNDCSTPTPSTASGTSYINNLAFDNVHNRLFAADYGNYRVLVFDFNGGISNGMDASYVIGQPDFTTNSNSLGQNVLGGAQGVDYDSNSQTLFVGDYNNSRVMVFDLSGGITNGMNASYVIGQPNFDSNTTGTTINSLTFVQTTAYDSKQKKLFVADYSDCRILTFDLSAGITNGMDASGVLGQPDFTSNDCSTISQSTFSDISGMTFDSTNKVLYITNYGNSRVLQYTFVRLTPTVQSGVVGTPYSTTLGSQSQGTTTYAITSGGLPPGIALNTSTGFLSGTPTTAGTYTFSIAVSDDNGAAGTFGDRNTYSLVITSAPAADTTTSTTSTSSKSTPTESTSSTTTKKISPTNLATTSEPVLTTTVNATVDLDSFGATPVEGYSLVATEGVALAFSLYTSTNIGDSGAPQTIQTHKITINKIAENKVTFTLASTPQQFTLGVGEQTTADLDGDEKPDVGLLVSSITSTTADIKIWKLTIKADSLSKVATTAVIATSKNNGLKTKIFILSLSLIMLIGVFLEFIRIERTNNPNWPASPSKIPVLAIDPKKSSLTIDKLTKPHIDSDQDLYL